MSAPFAPRNADEIADWAAARQVPFEIARRRFIQAAAIYVIAGETELKSYLRLFGSAVLSILHGTNRTSADLDFWCPPERVPDMESRHQIHDIMNQRLNQGLREFVPFNSHWREVLASNIKIQLCCDPAVKLEFQPIQLDYPSPREIYGYSLRAALGSKLLTHAVPLHFKRGRDADIYDVADAIRSHLVLPEQVVEMASVKLRQIKISPRADVDKVFALSKAAYRMKYDRGDYDIDWESALASYITLFRQVPELSHLRM